jgi:glutaconate CoA-transferase subunit B
MNKTATMEQDDANCTVGEIMAVAIARQLEQHDGEWIAVGAYSQLPMASVKLARMTRAPNMWWLSGGGGAINGTGKVTMSTSDYRTIRGAEYVMSMEDIVDIEMWRYQHENPKMTAIVGGIQIDRRGSSNMVGVGPYGNQTVRGVGTVGLCFGVSFNSLYFYTMHHNRKIFVEEVDFISSPGFTKDRAKYVPDKATGPRAVFTPLGIFDFAPDSGLMRIKSLHRGVTVEQVQDNTGFPMLVPETVPETPMPSDEDLLLLRTKVDPDGILRGLRITR